MSTAVIEEFHADPQVRAVKGNSGDLPDHFL